jgi:hypothetical protein
MMRRAHRALGLFLASWRFTRAIHKVCDQVGGLLRSETSELAVGYERSAQGLKGFEVGSG